MTEIPDDFLTDDDPPTTEDGRGDDQDGPLPEVDPDDYLDSEDGQ